MINIDITNLRGSLINNQDNSEELKIIQDYIDKVRSTLISLGLSTNNLDNNLKTLRVIKDKKQDARVSKDLDSRSLLASSTYNSKYNTISVGNTSEITHELFHTSSTDTRVAPDKRKTGVETPHHKYIAINEGITDMLAKMADKDSQINYPFEELIASILTSLFDGKILDSYINNNIEKFLSYLDNNNLNDLQENVDFILVTLDNFNKTNSLILSRVYNDKQDIQELLNKTNNLISYFYDILYTLYDICEQINYSKDNLTEFLKGKFKQKQFNSIRTMLDLDKINYENLAASVSLK